MSDWAIEFEDVWKSYPSLSHVNGGLKQFIFNLPGAVVRSRSMNGNGNAPLAALKGVTFNVKRGEACGIIGRNGAGKSTVLGLIAGVMKPTSGMVRVNGRVAPLLELGAGFHPDLSGIENIVLNGVILGLSKAEVRRRTDEIVEFSGLADMIREPVRTYSTGMSARLGFSVVAHLDPELLLIDEVLGVGDIDFQKRSLDKIRDFKKKGTTIVFVSHSLSDVNMICDTAIWLKGHELNMQGASEAVTRAYIDEAG
ncbi:MAG: ABC transporter ATP-binding protein [Deltaproteobacteria bacterium]|nr:ABC transporter ATP-binding protein [Deltaproteobacteria bacterium]